MSKKKGTKKKASASVEIIVKSKTKAYIKSKHQLNCGGDAIPRLEEIVKDALDAAAARAMANKRKTLQARDL